MTRQELEHYGVQGMKWGVRKADIHNSRRQIGQAYDKLATRGGQFDYAQGAAQTKRAKKEFADAYKNYKDVDAQHRLVAQRMTRGEKAYTAIAGTLALPVVGTALVPVIASNNLKNKYRQMATVADATNEFVKNN